jgi:hypothetical protein
MQSLELNGAYYRDCVSKTLEEHCPRIAERHAAALIGYGSEVLGNDDELSKRYGWGPRLLLFLTREDHKAWGEKLLAILNRHIPPTFLDHPTRFTSNGPPQPTIDPTENVGIAITTCERFIELYLGLSDIDVQTNPPTSKDWLLIYEAYLLRLTAGEVFHDGIGVLTALREYFEYFPDDVWRHRLAYSWAALDTDITLIATCAARGDILSSRIAVARTVERIISIVFLLNRTYKPGYLKWIHRQFHKLPHLASDIGSELDRLMVHENCATASSLLYPILDQIIEFQSEVAGIPDVDYKQQASYSDGCFDYNLGPITDSVRSTIQGELRDMRTTIGAVDQWMTDQDLIMVPSQLNLVAPLYDCDDPVNILFNRNRLEDKGI